jgi:hypothetical protein
MEQVAVTVDAIDSWMVNTGGVYEKRTVCTIGMILIVPGDVTSVVVCVSRIPYNRSRTWRLWFDGFQSLSLERAGARLATASSKFFTQLH